MQKARKIEITKDAQNPLQSPTMDQIKQEFASIFSK